MPKQRYIERYNAIVEKVRKGRCTLKEICEYLSIKSEDRDLNLTISSRTFNRDLDEIRDIYGIDIQYDRTQKVYYIANDQVANISNVRLMEAFDIFNTLKMSEHFSDFILFEERKPHGTQHFYPLLQAIKSKQKIKIVYRKFSEDENTERILLPFALKESKGRWYLLATKINDTKLKTYGLDRIISLKVLQDFFYSDFKINIKEKFKHSFGIISVDEGDPETVELSFTRKQGEYIKTYPLHESQQVVFENNEEIRVKLLIYVTYDFIMELLSFGSEMKVISPADLQEEIQESLEEALKNYTA
ncbi:MAG TPA: WYL domain-containing protein [Cytophagales bacterium]|nr:WYL domain-containing protein [Cytophagales bacterium]